MLIRNLAPRLIVFGVGCSVLGIAVYSQLGRDTVAAAPDLQTALICTSFALLAIGFLGSAGGGLLWALWAPPKRLALLGGIMAGSCALAFEYFPFNVHGWTASLALACLTTLLIAAIFVVLALVRSLTRLRFNRR